MVDDVQHSIHNARIDVRYHTLSVVGIWNFLFQRAVAICIFFYCLECILRFSHLFAILNLCTMNYDHYFVINIQANFLSYHINRWIFIVIEYLRCFTVYEMYTKDLSIVGWIILALYVNLHLNLVLSVYLSRKIPVWWWCSTICVWIMYRWRRARLFGNHRKSAALHTWWCWAICS